MLKGISAILVCVAALDLFWVGWAANSFYKARLGHLMSQNVFWPAAIMFYLLYPAGIWYFASRPSAALSESALKGAALGLVVYGVYNFTNMALLKGWGGRVAAVDIAWGMLLTAAASCAGFLAAAPRGEPGGFVR